MFLQHNPLECQTMTSERYLIPQINKPLAAEITLPGSKSIALRQLAIAALTNGETRISGIPACDDVDAMRECIETLGATVTTRGEWVVVQGPVDFTKDVTLDARMSGASTRLLLGIAALRKGSTTIDGHPSLRARTNAPLLDVFTAYGCQIESDGGCLPVTIQGPFRPPATLVIDGSLSSQYVTALLLCAPRYAVTSVQTITISGDPVSKPYIDITLNEMAKRGVQGTWIDAQQLNVEIKPYQPGAVQVEGDATAATYFAGLVTLHGGQLELTNLGASTRQGDYKFFEIMETLGATVERKPESTRIQGPRQIKALPVTDMNEMPDAALTLIAMAPLLPQTTKITGLSSLHHKECDRLECPAAEFRQLGIQATTQTDAIEVEPIEPDAIKAHTMCTYHDHRMAMAFSLLGSVSGKVSVDDKTVVNKTYPAYWQDYSKVAGLTN